MENLKLKVNIKGISNKQNKIKQIDIICKGPIKTVKDLICEVVRSCVADYNDRKDQSELLKVLSKEQIEDQALSGKVAFGVNYGDKKANIKQAEKNALQAFEDGVVVIFVDRKKLLNLEDEITLTDGSELTFVKMTMLAGRMW